MIIYDLVEMKNFIRFLYEADFASGHNDKYYNKTTPLIDLAGNG